MNVKQPSQVKAGNLTVSEREQFPRGDGIYENAPTCTPTFELQPHPNHVPHCRQVGSSSAACWPICSLDET